MVCYDYISIWENFNLDCAYANQIPCFTQERLSTIEESVTLEALTLLKNLVTVAPVLDASGKIFRGISTKCIFTVINHKVAICNYPSQVY